MDMDMGRLNVTVSRRAVLACGDARLGGDRYSDRGGIPELHGAQ